MPSRAKRQSLLDMSGKSGVAEQPHDLLPRPVRPAALRMLWSALIAVGCGLAVVVVLVRAAL